MNGKPDVLLEFDLSEVMFMKPVPNPAGSTILKDTLVIRDKAWGNTPTVAIYVVLGGVNVIPIAIPDDTTVTLEVKG